MCTQFLAGGYEGNVMARMLDCAKARRKTNGERVYDAGDLKVVDEIGQRYIDCGWLEKADEVTLEAMWQKTKNRIRNRRRSKKQR